MICVSKLISKLVTAILKSTSDLGMICTLNLILFHENTLLVYKLFQNNNNSYLFP